MKTVTKAHYEAATLLKYCYGIANTHRKVSNQLLKLWNHYKL